uniref:Uncharacterized protein n=1 Tax=Oryza sativa subsp. japonica TaxID=39947 RepID=Q67UF0_ORYSJ|nr:hypothetical protein [Oryza sativa Japonica Group]BAD38219.1 hypothetical protein [Oryza sativa Japonica Group]
MESTMDSGEEEEEEEDTPREQLWSHDAVVIEMERNRNAAKADISINGSITALHVLRIQDYSTGWLE